MSGKAFVLDSNFILDYLKGSPAHLSFMRKHIGHSFWASVITEMELYSFHGITDNEKKVLDDFMVSVKIAPLDESVKTTAIVFRRQSRRKLPDSIVAATAICRDAALMTSDQSLLRTVFPGFVVSTAGTGE